MSNDKITSVYVLFDDWVFDENIGREQIYDVYPRIVAAVNFRIESTGTLDRRADKARVEAGYRPCFLYGDAEDYDVNGWYDYYIYINDYNEHHIDNAIGARLFSWGEPDDDTDYLIPLSDEEQQLIYKSIDRQCRDVLGKSCEELLEDARKEVESWNL